MYIPFYKDIVFPVQAKCSLFSADFRLKINILVNIRRLVHDISILEGIGVYII